MSKVRLLDKLVQERAGVDGSSSRNAPGVADQVLSGSASSSDEDTTFDEKHIFEVLPDLPAGPLDVYRKNATFDWKAMKVAFEGEECIRYHVSIIAVQIKDKVNKMIM